MRIWIACFLVIFALTEVCQWVKHFSLPLPVNILFAVILAIASNFDKLFGVELPAANTPAEQISATNSSPVVTINNSPPSVPNTNSEQISNTQLKTSQNSLIDLTISPPNTPVKKHREPILPVLPKNR